jgi:short-subunit dehydrogenase
MLVLNAGWAESFYSHMMPESWVENQVTINVYQIPFLVRKILPQMKTREKKEGAIIIMSSMAAFIDIKTGKDYCASKGYALQYGNCIYHELKAVGIDVLTYCPSKINTPLLE